MVCQAVARRKLSTGRNRSSIQHWPITLWPCWRAYFATGRSPITVHSSDCRLCLVRRRCGLTRNTGEDYERQPVIVKSRNTLPTLDDLPRAPVAYLQKNERTCSAACNSVKARTTFSKRVINRPPDPESGSSFSGFHCRDFHFHLLGQINPERGLNIFETKDHAMEQTQPDNGEPLEPQQAAAKAALLAECDQLASAAIAFVAVHFDGYGDDGTTEEVKCYHSDWYASGEHEPVKYDASH